MGTLQIWRLTLGAPPAQLAETVGDPVANVGGAVVPAARNAMQLQVALATYLATAPSAASGQTLRRQLRSLLNNEQLKLGGFLYVIYTDDTELNGWYAPDQTTLSGVDKTSWQAVGLWQTQPSGWLLLGHRRTHKAARQVWLKDLRTAGYDRDTLGWIRSTDFAALPALALNVLPNGATGASLTVSGQAIAGAPLPVGRDGGQCSLVQGLSDLQVVSFERAEAALNLSDVIVYDRRGGFIVQTGLVRSAGAYQLQPTDLGVVQLTSGATSTLPIGLTAAVGPAAYVVKDATAGTVPVSTGTAGKIDAFTGGNNATTMNIAAGEAGVFMPDTNYIDWISL